MTDKIDLKAYGESYVTATVKHVREVVPSLFCYAQELESTNNSQIDVIRELRAKVEWLNIECSKAVSERNSYGIHAASLAGAVEIVIGRLEKCNGILNGDPDKYSAEITVNVQCWTNARAALAAYREATAQGGDGDGNVETP